MLEMLTEFFNTVSNKQQNADIHPDSVLSQWVFKNEGLSTQHTDHTYLLYQSALLSYSINK